jgi:MFS family permease
MSKAIKNKGWAVVLAGTGINLALGILYTWSIFKGEIRASIESNTGLFNWNLASINDPYAVCCLVFAFAMILAGKCQDQFGPRFTARLGGLLVGAGFIMISQTTSYLGWVIGFGLLVGTGLGFGYSSATPPALKWFPPAKTGLIAGIVVSGFGLASVYIAPLAKYLIGTWGLQTSMLFFGIAFAIVVGLLSNLLVNPPEGFSVTKPASAPRTGKELAAKSSSNVDVTPSTMVKSMNFYILWTIFFVGSGAGLMVIGSVAGMAKKGLGEMAFIAVALMAIGNAAGRIVAGTLSDKIGRSATLIIMLVFQAALMFAAIPVVGAGSGNVWLLVLLASFIGFNYGTNLAIFPSFAKDFWGLKNFGTNYGILFSAWGVGGFVMGRVSQMIQASTGSYNMSFMIAGGCLLFAAALTLRLKPATAAKPSLEIEQPVPTRMRVGSSWLMARPKKVRID